MSLGQKKVAPEGEVYDTRALKSVAEEREMIVVLTQGYCWEMRWRRPKKDGRERVAKACPRLQTCSCVVVVAEHEMGYHPLLESQHVKQTGL
jgi:hypothetical protein